MIDINSVERLQREMVIRWHRQSVDNPYQGFLGLVCHQHACNYQLWHEEDVARSPNVDDTRIAQVKRAIDRLNQQRNDGIEKLDDWLTGELLERRISAAPHAPLNSETVGSIIDRLSILSLRSYHLLEQCERTDATPEHILSCRRKLAICEEQRSDLIHALHQLLHDIQIGRKRHKTYRQLKMYNDPALNPYLYSPRRAG